MRAGGRNTMLEEEILFKCGDGSLMLRRSNRFQPEDRVWCLPPEPGGDAARLAREAALPLPLAQVLSRRGWTSAEAIAAFLSADVAAMSDPFLMKGMREGVARIAEALRRGERIVVYGDYDVDGQCSTALMLSALRRAGGRVDYFIPHRIDEGYGLHVESIRNLADRADLLVTVDCGITAVAEVAEAHRLGMDVVVTDHHEPGEELPAAVAVINPKQPGCPYPDKGLAGCGVAFRLVEALYRHLGEDPAQVWEWSDLVALATVADVVPLVGENRIIVRQGLPRFRHRLGLRRLMEVAGVAQEEPSVGQVGFQLAPRLNAAGRMADASAAVELLLTDDPDEAERLAVQLDAENTRRREVEQAICEAAEAWVEAHADLDEDRALVVEGDGWHPGVIGIVASRLVERYHRPVIVLSRAGDEAVGSGRSIEGFDLIGALHTVGHLMQRFGGHAAAAGLTIRTADIPRFRDAFLREAARRLSKDDLLPTLRIDALLTASEVDVSLAEAVARFAPFGVGNPEPVFALPPLQVVESRSVGQDQQHWRLVLRSSRGEPIDAIGFDMAPAYAARFAPGDWVQAAGTLSLDEWNGRPRVQLRLRDVRKAETGEADLLEATLRRIVGGRGRTAEERPAVPYVAVERMVVPWGDATVEVHAVDLRGNGIDPRIEALRLGAAADTLFVWVAGSSLRGGEGWSSIRIEDGASPGRIGGRVCRGGVPVNAPAGIRHARVAVVFWDVPADEAELAAAVSGAATWSERIDLYLTFTPEGVEAVMERMAADFPPVDALRRIYVRLRQRVPRPGPLPVAALRAELMRDAVAASSAGIRYALRLFAETGLLRIHAWDDHVPFVEVVAPPAGKVDLGSSVRYNDAEERRERAKRFGRLALAASGAELIGRALGARIREASGTGSTAERQAR